ncbi:acyl-CoA thioester hydrolase/BAAT C-terminal domain-containing protein [Brucellaceae bacterium C25G]
MHEIKLTVSPERALVDVARTIRVTGLEAGEIVSIRTSTIRAGGVVWDSQASFLADHDGIVDLTRDAPCFGDYAEISPMGLIWSQEPQSANSQDVFADDVMQPITTTLTATTLHGRTAQAEMAQVFADEDVQRQEIREDGLVATLFTPQGEGPYPVVIVLNGSGGGINEARGALYASRGYQALALGYFKAAGLPRYISNTPLEYFQKAITWVKEILKPADGFIALSGQSRGGELSLLLASMFPQDISAAIAYVPAAVLHGAQGAADPQQGGWSGPTWTWKDEPLDHLWNNNEAVDWHPWDGAPPPHRHHSVYLAGLSDKARVEKSRIPVEKITGDVLLISGLDDRAWPSSLYSKMVAETFRQNGRNDHAVHLDYANAGHSINLPYVPSTQITRMHPVSKVPFTSGGNASGNAHADEESWQGVLLFLGRLTGKTI